MFGTRGRWIVLLLAFLLSTVAQAGGPGPKHRTENVIFVMTDGLRWQEVFQGAEESLLGKADEGKKQLDPARAAYWRDTPEARRAALMPFLWNVVAKQGQVFGNQDKGSPVQVTNGLNFSYPGFSETLCGVADPRINSNGKNFNPNMNVLEWLHGIKGFHGRTAAFGAWDLFPYILNRKRSGILVNAGYEPFEAKRMTPAYAVLNRLKAETIRYWGGEPFDSLTLETALEYLKTEKPRVLFLALGETDEWAHEGRYDKYLESAHRADEAMKIIWETAQSMRYYRGKTTLILSTDHGRGFAPEGWKGHGEDCPNSEKTWCAFMGPDTPVLGERSQTNTIGANQLAATLAAFLGEDYCAGVPAAGKPIREVSASLQR